jgi:YfiH family protein
MVHRSPFFSLYFGNARDEIYPPVYANLPAVPLVTSAPFDRVATILGARHMMFVRQTHSAHGLLVDDHALRAIRPFTYAGDYLITNKKQVAIGVMTADCLPVLIYDPNKRAAAAVHAGWRGALEGVVVRALEHMAQEYGTRAQEVEVFFGPSAGVCCYEVSPDFNLHLAGFSRAEVAKVLVQKDGAYFFDLPLCVQDQLVAAQVPLQNVHREYGMCTMHNTDWCSYRRDGQDAGRQMSVICMR